jgi:hypothetical protein
MTNRYYTEEITAVPFRIIARTLRNSVPPLLAYALAALWRGRGLLRWPLSPLFATGEPGSKRVVESAQLPPRALFRMAGYMEQLLDLGFTPLEFALADVIGPRVRAFATYLAGDGRTIASLEWQFATGTNSIEEQCSYELNSFADADPEISTVALDPQALPFADLFRIEFVDLQVVSNELSMNEVHQLHQARIASRSCRQPSAAAALAELERRNARRFEWSQNRGYTRWLKPHEVERLRAATPDGAFWASAPEGRDS